ncbi:hypothetical protein EPN52_13705 [bacterium]|nr:MAG: hypothetical protein EPN52_13705 [bacterium]
MKLLSRITLAVTLLLSCSLAVVPQAAFAKTHVQATAPANAGTLQFFETESAAQAHCPKDTVVWLNTRSGIYHLKGERWYGRTKHGAYVCQIEADSAGDRETRNGQ